MTDADLLDQVADANGALAVAGQRDMVWGHVSLRSPDGRGVLMKAAALGFEEIGRDQVLLVSPEGEVLEGHGRRHIEFFIHTEIMRARPDVNAVVHTHSVNAAAFGSLDTPLRPLNHDAALFLLPELPRFTRSGDLIRDAEIGAALAATLGDARGVLIPGHGMVTVGESLASAVMHAVLLDHACRLQLEALAAGGPQRWSSDAEVASKQQNLWTTQQVDDGYRYLVRRAVASGFGSAIPSQH
jgi:ribulose-5-phosphate 4-epimerase/fuculose-1-phosphate aldolase